MRSILISIACLQRQVTLAEVEWRREAEQAISEQVDPVILANLRQDAGEQLAELASAIDDINARLRLAANTFELPLIDVPGPEIAETLQGKP